MIRLEQVSKRFETGRQTVDAVREVSAVTEAIDGLPAPLRVKAKIRSQ